MTLLEFKNVLEDVDGHLSTSPRTRSGLEAHVPHPVLRHVPLLADRRRSRAPFPSVHEQECSLSMASIAME